MSLIIPEHFINPKCPQNTVELDMLIYALTDEKFDKTPEELQTEAEKFAEKARQKGKPEKLIQLYLRTAGDCQDIREARAYMQKWGRTRGEAIRKYMTHFNQPCLWCMDLYTDILRDYVRDRANEEGLDLIDLNIAERLLTEAHLYFLGNPALNEAGAITIDDLFRTRN